MLEDNKYDISDLISNVVAQQPIEFEKTFNELMVDKINDLITNKKIEIAQTMFGSSDYSEEE